MYLGLINWPIGNITMMSLMMLLLLPRQVPLLLSFAKTQLARVVRVDRVWAAALNSSFLKRILISTIFNNFKYISKYFSFFNISIRFIIRLKTIKYLNKPSFEPFHVLAKIFFPIFQKKKSQVQENPDDWSDESDYGQ